LAYFYRGADREQLFLMPMSMREWLSEGHLAWFVIDVVERMDTSALAPPQRRGRAPGV
jgi:hypothetical protein